MKKNRASPDAVADGPLRQRYGPGALAVFDAEERRRFLQPDGQPRDGEHIAWELLYRLEPELYDRLIAGERLHPGLWEWLPSSLGTVLELGAGTGRLTLPLARRCERLTATDPSRPLLQILQCRLAESGLDHVTVERGYFDEVAVADGSCDLVIACSAFTPSALTDPVRCLVEMERCCRPGGMVVLVWPNSLDWLDEQGFRRIVFDGSMAVDFGSVSNAIELARIFYPDALTDVLRHNSPTVPYEMLGMSPPRDLCWKRKP